jgi:hypothetical protein
VREWGWRENQRTLHPHRRCANPHSLRAVGRGETSPPSAQGRRERVGLEGEPTHPPPSPPMCQPSQPPRSGSRRNLTCPSPTAKCRRALSAAQGVLHLAQASRALPPHSGRAAASGQRPPSVREGPTTDRPPPGSSVEEALSTPHWKEPHFLNTRLSGRQPLESPARRRRKEMECISKCRVRRGECGGGNAMGTRYSDEKK